MGIDQGRRTRTAEVTILLTEDEAAFIALHFVNAQLGGEIRDIYDMTYLLQAVFRIM